VLVADRVLQETVMHAHPTEPHYAPASVGALMDPTFLRDAVRDANGDYRTAERLSPMLLLRWRDAMRALAAACRQR
jgi:hypothetical protein